MNDGIFILPNEVLFAEVEDCIARKEDITIPFQGTSMGHLLHTNEDKITLSPIVKPLEVGNVVLFRYRGMHILHRIVRIEGETIITRGDACISNEQIKRAEVVAILTSVYRKNGKKIVCSGSQWKRMSRHSILRNRSRQLVARLLPPQRRKKLSVLYFIILIGLMWLPLNGLDLQLNQFVLGIRADHFLHATIYIPSTFFLMDHNRLKGWRIWIVAILIAIATELGQLLLPYRGFDINDMIANFVGVTLGWLPLLRHRKN